jgi:hypothetical protein
MSNPPLGSPPLTDRVVPFRARDGMECNLINVRSSSPPSRGPVILVHGAGVRAEVFRPPRGPTIADYLVARGYDVWLENWRASIDLAPNPWTLDQAAVLDHPEAVRTVVNETGSDRVKAIVHCQGSCSFVMSVVAGLTPAVDTVVSNAVSLHPIVPFGSRFKLDALLPFVGAMTKFLNPRWGDEAPTLPAKLIAMMGRMTHGGCDNEVCKQVSFTYGSGDPALWLHENIDDATHDWIRREFANVPVSFFRQMARCIRRGHLVRVEPRPELPADFCAGEPQTDARFALFGGDRNRCFLPASQTTSYDFFNRHRRDFHSLHILPGYSHLDVFWGKRSAEEIFPLMAAELERPTAASRRSPPVRGLSPATPSIAAPDAAAIAPPV